MSSPLPPIAPLAPLQQGQKRRSLDPGEQTAPSPSLKKHKITEKEWSALASYVEKNEAGWRTSLIEGERLSISKKGTGLPRTLRVFKERGELYAMALCSRKSGAPIFSGTEATFKLAIDMLTKKTWARRIESLEENMDEHWVDRWKLPEGHPGIISPIIGAFANRQKEPATLEFFMPYREGALSDADFRHFSQERVVSIFSQLFSALVHLEEKELVHGDIGVSNVLYYNDEQGNFRVQLTDFETLSPYKKIHPKKNLAEARQTETIFNESSAIGDLYQAAHLVFDSLLQDPKDRFKPSLYTKLCALSERMKNTANSAQFFSNEFQTICREEEAVPSLPLFSAHSSVALR